MAPEASRAGAVVAIDPGTSNTGLVYMDESRRVLCAKTVSLKGAVKGDQALLMERARAVADGVAAWMADKPHDAVVVEGFVGYSGRQGGYTYQTPYLLGYLHRALEGENVVAQTSRQVLNPRTRGNVAWLMDELRYRAGAQPVKGAALLTNEHLRSAACHAYYYYKMRQMGEKR